MKRLATILAMTSLTACSYFGSGSNDVEPVVTLEAPVEAQAAVVDPQPNVPAAEVPTEASTGTKSITSLIPKSTLAIADAWAMTSPRGQKVASGYLTVANGGAESDRLISASTPRAARAGIYAISQESGVAKLRPVPAVEVPTGGSAVLGERGPHLVFIDVDTPFTEGETIPVMLTFEKAGKIEVTMRVKPGSKVVAVR